jgi:hypothetical protein
MRKMSWSCFYFLSLSTSKRSAHRPGRKHSVFPLDLDSRPQISRKWEKHFCVYFTVTCQEKTLYIKLENVCIK